MHSSQVMRSFLYLICLVFFIATQVFADAPTLDQRPMTKVNNIVQTFQTLKSLPGFMIGSYTTRQKRQAFINAQAPSYNRGADFSEILGNSLDDIRTILKNFYPCWQGKVVGACLKVSWTGIYVGPYVEYRVPVHKIDNHPQDLQHHYIPRVMNKLLLPVNEMVYYRMLDKVAESSVKRAVDGTKLQGQFAGYRIPNAPGYKTDTAVINNIKAAIPREKRHRAAIDPHGGWIKNEFMILPELFRVVVGRIPFFNVHIPLAPGIWASDWPTGILAARWPMVSFVVAPFEMVNRYVFPHNCASINSWLQGGKTPPDMLLTGNAVWDTMHLVWPSAGCLAGNNGPWVPITNGAYTPFSSAAATVGTMKAMKASFRFQPFATYKVNLKKDRRQFTRNKRMPMNCGKLETYVGNFKDGNSNKDVIDPWYQVEYWKYFRGCQPGYFPIAAWDGEGLDIIIR